MSEPDATERPLPTLAEVRAANRRGALAGVVVALVGGALTLTAYLTGDGRARTAALGLVLTLAVAVVATVFVGPFASGLSGSVLRRLGRRELLEVGNRRRRRRLARAVLLGRTDRLDADDRRVCARWAPVARVRAEARTYEWAFVLVAAAWFVTSASDGGASGLRWTLVISYAALGVGWAAWHLVWRRALRRLPDDVAAP